MTISFYYIHTISNYKLLVTNVGIHNNECFFVTNTAVHLYLFVYDSSLQIHTQKNKTASDNYQSGINLYNNLGFNENFVYPGSKPEKAFDLISNQKSASKDIF
ncbi:hypothetical protein D3C80_924000 [compost metagenome]